MDGSIKMETFKFDNETEYNAFLQGINIGEEMGSGSYATVYDVMNATAVIKIGKLKPSLGTTFIKKLQNEVTLGDIAGKAGVGPRIHKYGLFYIGEKVRFFIIMEKLAGKPSEEDICTPKFQRDIVNLYKKLSDLKILHGDTNHQNFMINSEGKLVLIDFGMSKLVKTYEAAVDKNIFYLLVISLGAYGVLKKCRDCTPFVQELKKMVTEKNRKDIVKWRPDMMIDGKRVKTETLL